MFKDKLISSFPEGGILAVLREMMNFRLLADPLFFLIGISNAFAMIGFYTPFVYLPNMAIVTGVSVPDASFLVSVIFATIAATFRMICRLLELVIHSDESLPAGCPTSHGLVSSFFFLITIITINVIITIITIFTIGVIIVT